jgi:ESCRT-II complex subunit VPS25
MVTVAVMVGAFCRLQPTEETREKQLATWCSLVLQYARAEKLNRLVVADAAGLPLFHNAALHRTLSLEGIRAVLDRLAGSGRSLGRSVVRVCVGIGVGLSRSICRAGHVEWDSAEKEACVILWRSPAQWADLLWAWVGPATRRAGR